MSRRSNSNKVGYEPIPGYVLRKRLGAGGYGEVWLADAPGGLQKAVKLIYGTIDESHASSELRSLQRIRSVYHPFLLSLERIEVINGEVIIITELAESSLLDRFEVYRRKGAPGIPRAMLLDYLRDTADALDFLATKHALQHLDVKPGNLLIIADRIKVADFGLIKDLHDQNQSLVSGLTPTYSAPEIFDGRPDYRSDQYSLAIVYMEMLTGCLPFDGKTTGELARQHINQAPNLEALPPADRHIVSRALSKNPLDRFASCRQFVEQLLKTRSSVLPSLNQSAGSQKLREIDEEDTGRVETIQSTQLGAKQEFQDAIDIDQLREEWSNSRSMFIGLGGIGGQSLVSLYEAVNRDCDNVLGVKDHRWLAIDTDHKSLNNITDDGAEVSLPTACAVQLPIYRPSEYRNASPELFGPLSRRWLYNIPRSLSTEGVRPLAILTLLDHYTQLKSKIQAELRELIKQQDADDSSNQPLRIYLLSSLHGGTGSALLAEVGLLIRRLLAEFSYTNYRISAVVSAATTTNNHTASLPTAAALASLSELSHLMHPETIANSIYFGDGPDCATTARPFDWVTLVDGGFHGNKQEMATTCYNIAKVVLLDSQTMAGAALAESRCEANKSRTSWLRTAAAMPIEVSADIDFQKLARWCCEQTLSHALTYMSGPRGVATSSVSITDSTPVSRPTISGDLPLTDNACDEFTRRLLLDLGVFNPVGGTAPTVDARHNDIALSQWARRLSSNEELLRAQLSQDMVTWKKSISNIVQMRVYNWKQVEQIQLNVIAGVLDYCDNEATQLVKSFEPFSNMLGTEEQMLRSAVSYLQRFAEECVKLLNHFQREGKALASRIDSWCSSIDAEKSLNESSWEVNLLALSPRMQLLASRVNAVLETTVHRLAHRALQESADALDLLSSDGPDHEVEENVNLSYMLNLSADLVGRISSELGIAEEHCEKSNTAQEGVSMKELDKFVPVLSESGGQIHRLIVTPAEQLALVAKAIGKQNLLAKTTLVASTRSLGSYVLCDGLNLSLPQLIGSLWRPTAATMQLAERLRTRTDIDWEPATQLLEAESFAEDATVSKSSANDQEQSHEATNVVVLANVDLQSLDMPVDAARSGSPAN